MNAKKNSKKKIKEKNFNFQKIKEKKMIILLIKKINKIGHSCNLLRISFFKGCVKEDVVAAVFMLELTLFQIFGPRNEIFFCPLFVLQRGISNAICDLVL